MQLLGCIKKCLPRGQGLTCPVCLPACLPAHPLPRREHQAALKAGVAGGVLQLVGTDHAVFNSSQKAVGRADFRLIPNGVNGLEVGGWVGGWVGGCAYSVVSLGWAA